MWTAILGAVSPMMKGLFDLIDDLHTSEEEKAQIKAQAMMTQATMAVEMMKHEQKILQMQTDVIKAEARANSWLTRTWRPITMMAFLGLVLSYWLGYTPPNVSEEAVFVVFDLIKLGLGGYVIGRSAEKIALPVVEMFKKDK